MKEELPENIEKALNYGVDFFFKLWPQAFPVRDRLKSCKIISHRGEHNNSTIYENTIPAFDLACEQGLWGIEFDVRWTKDFHPVVIHDPDLKRVFGLAKRVDEVTLIELKSCCPVVPSLVEVVEKYTKKLHLMIEIKEEVCPDTDRLNDILKEILAPLTPRRDYHLMSLSPAILDRISFVPASTLIPIAWLDVDPISRLVLEKDYGGIAGHYFLLDNAKLVRHHKEGQKVGVGFPASRNCLFREINRGVEWIFSNNAGRLQRMVERYARESPESS